MSLFYCSDFHSFQFNIDPFIDALQQSKRLHAIELDRPVCKLYNSHRVNSCPRGSDCPYKHNNRSNSSSHSSDSTDVVCKHWLRGLCKKGENCEFLHEYDLSKMPVCHFFSTFGECHNNDCPFLHVKAIDNDKECPFYIRGFCKHGNHCQYRHTRKIACPHYLAGFCIKGPQCQLGHPKFEISSSTDSNNNSNSNPIAPESSDELMLQQPDMPSRDRAIPNRKPKETIQSLQCHRCQQFGHFAAACPNVSEEQSGKAVRPLSQVTCFKCGEVGHYASFCTQPRRTDRFAANNPQSARR
jgi:cleavage and polyadenylation specificity factor subunit 4